MDLKFYPTTWKNFVLKVYVNLKKKNYSLLSGYNVRKRKVISEISLSSVAKSNSYSFVEYLNLNVIELLPGYLLCI